MLEAYIIERLNNERKQTDKERATLHTEAPGSKRDQREPTDERSPKRGIAIIDFSV